MLWFQDVSFWNWSFENNWINNNYLLNFIDSCTKSFLNKLYISKVMVPNVPKRNVFVKLPLLGTTSFQIQKKLQKLFSDKLTSCNLKIVFTSPVLSCYFQDLLTSISVVAAMLPIMERPNAILKSEFVNI